VQIFDAVTDAVVERQQRDNVRVAPARSSGRSANLPFCEMIAEQAALTAPLKEELPF
jgi:hypothetical protein